MRRSDKAITDRELLDKVIRGSEICHLACCLNDQPYLIPISFGYDGQSIFFHSAQEGKKVSIISQNPLVCLAFESHVQLISHPELPCKWSFDYSSVIIRGIAQQLEDLQEKASGLNQIMRHYSGRTWDLPSEIIRETALWSVSILEITGKMSFTRGL